MVTVILLARLTEVQNGLLGQDFMGSLLFPETLLHNRFPEGVGGGGVYPSAVTRNQALSVRCSFTPYR